LSEESKGFEVKGLTKSQPEDPGNNNLSEES
jgi:hypothetical protein